MKDLVYLKNGFPVDLKIRRMPRIFMIFFGVILILPVRFAGADIVLNELIMSNGSVMGDNTDENDYREIIEIYNTSDLTINLEGYGLTNDPEKPLKWTFPDVKIASGARKVIIASEKNSHKTEDEEGNSLYLHTNFRLSATGDFVGLTRPSGEWADSVTTSFVPRDHSYARYPDGRGEWHYFPEPSAGKENSGKNYPGRTKSKVKFTRKGGNYDEPVTVEMAADDEDAEIYFTINGGEPGKEDHQYRKPVEIASTTVLRARVIEEDKMPGEITSATYLINEDVHLPVVSIMTDPAHFWDIKEGIYVYGAQAPNYEERGGEWERFSHIEFIEKDGNSALNMPAGVRIHGGKTRQFGQKSLRLYARGGYASFGSGSFDYPFFEHRDQDSFKRLILRNSGNDWNATMLRSAFQQTLHRPLDIAFREYEPAVVYLNGNYWGIYNIRDREDKYFIEREKGYHSDSIYMIANRRSSKYGGIEAEYEWESLKTFADNFNLAEEEYFREVCDEIDIDNFITFQVANIYANNYDWPGNNNIKYKPVNPEGKWRWILKDFDFGFQLWHSDYPAYEHNMLRTATQKSHGWPNPQWSTLLLRNLLENEEFRNNFINRFADHLNTLYHPERVSQKLHSTQSLIKNEIGNHITTWADSGKYLAHSRSVPEWHHHIETMHIFAWNRPANQRKHIKEKFDIPETHSLAIDIRTEETQTTENSENSPGTVRLNDHITLSEEVLPAGPVFPWEGKYFSHISVKLEAKPGTGYTFSHWEGDKPADTTEITWKPTGDTELTAVFKKKE